MRGYGFEIFGTINFLVLLVLMRKWLKKTTRDFFSSRHHLIKKAIEIADERYKISSHKLKLANEKHKQIGKEIGLLKKVMEEVASYEEWDMIEKGESLALKIKSEMERYLSHERDMKSQILNVELIKNALVTAEESLRRGLTLEQRRDQLNRSLKKLSGFKEKIKKKRIDILNYNSRYSTAERYAKAFFQAIEKHNSVQSSLRSLAGFLSLMNQEKMMKDFLYDYSISKDSKKNFIEAFFKGNIKDEILCSFLKLLTDKGRLYLLDEIGFACEEMYKQKNNICTIEITSATMAEGGIVEEYLRGELYDENLSSFEFKIIEDPSIVGGAKVGISDFILDASVMGFFNDMKNKLLEGINEGKA